MTKVYVYKNCDSCRKALQWLNTYGILYESIAIREEPPSYSELKTMLAVYGGDIKRLFNTSGKDYRELELATQIKELPEDELLALLRGNGNLVKRPFLIQKNRGIVGFKEAEWDAFFAH